jgi:hypothetical protein
MTPAEAEREIAVMQAILRDYEAPDLFAGTARNAPGPSKEEER